MEGRFSSEEHLAELRLPSNVASNFINKMLGPGRYFKVHVGRMAYNLVLGADSPAYMTCKQKEREHMMALSWEKVALTFWADRDITADEVRKGMEKRVYGVIEEDLSSLPLLQVTSQRGTKKTEDGRSSCGNKRTCDPNEPGNDGEAETDIEDSFDNPWDQVFVDLIKNKTDKANINLSLIYEQAQKKHSKQNDV